MIRKICLALFLILGSLPACANVHWGGRGMGHSSRKTTQVAASSSATISAPTLAQTSSAGTSPFTWDETLDATVYAGYNRELQEDNNSDFSSPEEDLTKQITESEMAGGPTDLSLALTNIPPPYATSTGTPTAFATWSGLAYMRERVRRDDGVDSPWSNTISDTIALAVALAASGNDHSPNITVSGGPPALTYLTNGGTGNTEFNRLNRAASGAKTHVEITLTTWTANSCIGIDNGTDNFNQASPSDIPGRTDATGVNFNGFDGVVKNSDGTTVSVVQPVSGDIMVIEWDATNVTFWTVHSGTPSSAYTTTHGLGTAALRLFVGHQASGGNDAGTVNVGGGAYAKTPTATYGNY